MLTLLLIELKVFCNLRVNFYIDINTKTSFFSLKKASGCVFPTVIKAKLDEKTNVHRLLFWETVEKIKI